MNFLKILGFGLFGVLGIPACDEEFSQNEEKITFRNTNEEVPNLKEIQDQAYKNLNWKIETIKKDENKQNMDYLDILDLVSTPKKLLKCGIVVDYESGAESEICCKSTAFGLLRKCCSNINKQNTTFCTYERLTMIEGSLPNNPPLL